MMLPYPLHRIVSVSYLLRDVLDFFMDYEIKVLPERDKSKEAKMLK